MIAVDTVRVRIHNARARNPACEPPCPVVRDCRPCDVEDELRAALRLLNESEQSLNASDETGHESYSGYRLVEDPSEPFA